MVENSLIESESFKGYYLVPGVNGIAVNTDGVVINNKNGKPYAGIKSQGYRAITVNDKTLNVHRLVAETFIRKPKDHTGKLYVNHINGIRSDNRLCNLEWVTPQGNAVHAYETGLRKDNKPVLIKNIEDGKIERFYSLQACARYFGTNAANIHQHLKRKTFNKVIFDKYLLIEENEAWPNLDELIYPTPDAKEVFVIDKNRNKKILFDSITAAAEEYGIGAGTLSKKLRIAARDNCDCEINGCVFSYYRDEGKGPYFEVVKRASKSKGNTKSPRKPLKIEVVDLETKEKKQWDSSQQYADHLGVAKNTFQKHISINDGVWKNRFKVSYLPFNSSTSAT